MVKVPKDTLTQVKTYVYIYIYVYTYGKMEYGRTIIQNILA